MRKFINLAFSLALVAILVVGSVSAQEVIMGDEDPETSGVWLFSAGTDVPAGAPTDDIIDDARAFGILEYIGNVASEVSSFANGPPEGPPGADPGETARDNTLALVVEGLTEVDDFGFIEEGEDPTANYDAGIGGWVILSNFGNVFADGTTSTGSIGSLTAPANQEQADEALGGFEIFIFEDATCSGYICTLYVAGSSTYEIEFSIVDRQVDPDTPNSADDTLTAIDLDTLGLQPNEYVYQIKIQDDSIAMTNPGPNEDTTLELDAVATRIGVIYGSISGLKWHDNDEDGIKDAGENTISGWHIYLSGPVSDSTTTIYDGTYIFTNLPTGTYTVSEEHRPGWNQTYPDPPGEHTVILDPGEIVTDIDFGNNAPPSVGGEGELVAATITTYLLMLLTIATVGAALYIAFKGKLRY